MPAHYGTGYVGGRRALTAARSFLLMGLTATLMAVAATSSGAAHPHVFVEYSFDLLFTNDGLHGLRITWVFDEFYSSLLRQTYDVNRDGQFSPEETRRLEQEQFKYFRAFHYNTDILLNGTPVPVPEARDFQPSVRDQRVAFTFSVLLSALGQREGTLEVIADDPDYYFAMAYDARTPARAVPTGSAHVTCARSKERQPSKPLGVTCAFRR